MNLILEKSKFLTYYTYLDPIFEAAPELTDFTYLISNLAINGSNDQRLWHDPVILPGIDLRGIVEKEKIQFIWAVLSAFDHEPSIPQDLPYADGNSTFWQGEPTPQLSDAEFEIVCWDSGATLFIGVSSTVAARLRQRFPDIADLNEKNRTSG